MELPVQLGFWVSQQRSSQRRGTLSPDKHDRLQQLVDRYLFTWNVNESILNPKHAQDWERKYRLLGKYGEVYGNYSVSQRFAVKVPTKAYVCQLMQALSSQAQTQGQVGASADCNQPVGASTGGQPSLAAIMKALLPLLYPPQVQADGSAAGALVRMMVAAYEILFPECGLVGGDGLDPGADLPSLAGHSHSAPNSMPVSVPGPAPVDGGAARDGNTHPGEECEEEATSNLCFIPGSTDSGSTAPTISTQAYPQTQDPSQDLHSSLGGPGACKYVTIKLGSWVTLQRWAYKRGTLHPDKYSKLSPYIAFEPADARPA